MLDLHRHPGTAVIQAVSIELISQDEFDKTEKVPTYSRSLASSPPPQAVIFFRRDHHLDQRRAKHVTAFQVELAMVPVDIAVVDNGVAHVAEPGVVLGDTLMIDTAPIDSETAPRMEFHIGIEIGFGLSLMAELEHHRATEEDHVAYLKYMGPASTPLDVLAWCQVGLQPAKTRQFMGRAQVMGGKTSW